MSRRIPATTIDGVGDVALAGYPTPYPHLRRERALPSVGTLFAMARRIGDTLRLAPPPMSGEWTDTSAHSFDTSDALDGATAMDSTNVVTTVVALPPTGVIVVPTGIDSRGTGAGVSDTDTESAKGTGFPEPHMTAPGSETLLYAASGEAHVVEISATGHPHGVRALAAGRGLMWGARRHHHVINTGSAPTLLVHARSLGA